MVSLRKKNTYFEVFKMLVSNFNQACPHMFQNGSRRTINGSLECSFEKLEEC